MKIEITTEFETSYTAQYRTKIVAKISNNDGVVLCTGEDHDSWPGPDERRASAKAAVSDALETFQRMLDNAKDVTKKSGLS